MLFGNRKRNTKVIISIDNVDIEKVNEILFIYKKILHLQ